MSMQPDFEILERAVQAGGRLLRVEADREGATSSLLVLTFDVGRIVVAPAPEGLTLAAADSREALPSGLVSLEEQEPWWRLIGQPVTAAWPGGVEEGVGAQGLGSLMILKMRFREESENPRIVVLEATGSALRVSLEG